MTRKPVRFYVAGLLGRIVQQSEMRTRYGFKISGNTRDMVGRYIFTFGRWEPGLSAFVSSRVRQDTHFYDLGTNIGFFSLLAASFGAKVNGFDASPEMAAVCRKNAENAGFTATIHNVAIAPERGELILYDRSGPTNTGSRTIIASDSAKIHARVPAAPLTSIVTLDPDAYNFFKIDIEGAERPVLDELAGWMASHPEARVTIVAEIDSDIDAALAPFISIGCTVKFLLNDYSFDAYRQTNDSFKLVESDERVAGYRYEAVIERV